MYQLPPTEEVVAIFRDEGLRPVHGAFYEPSAHGRAVKEGWEKRREEKKEAVEQAE